MRLLAATIACLLALATGAVAEAAAPTPMPAPYEFMLLYERSGGFAPSNRGLIVAPGQFASAEVSGGPRAKKRRADFHLSNRRIRTLERMLRRADFTSLQTPGPSGCADCFEYMIDYFGHQLEFDESQMPPRIGPVIAEIEAIISSHLKPRSP